jgi:hypothetical protein
MGTLVACLPGDNGSTARLWVSHRPYACSCIYILAVEDHKATASATSIVAGPQLAS